LQFCKQKFKISNRNLFESLINALYQIEDKLSGLEDVDELEHLDKNKEKKGVSWTCKMTKTPLKDQTYKP
jgi:hypothetical protein